MDLLKKFEDQPWYEAAYKVSVAVKGFDGLVEFIAGIWLLVAPDSLHALLQFIFGHAVEHSSHFMQFVAAHVAHIDSSLSAGGVLLVALFLLSHGVVKLALVYCLLREILWAYPYALGVLGAFLAYQLWVFIKEPSIGMFIFCILDVIIMVMVYGEWQKLKRENEKGAADNNE